MKTRSQFSPGIRAPLGFSSGCLLAMFLSASALAEFSGRDSLAAESDNWEPMSDHSDKGRFIFQNSRLEYWARDPEIADHRAILRWTPNRGSYNHDWFVQVDVHFTNFRVDEGRHANLNLGVINAADHDEGYMVAIDRGSKMTHTSGFKTITMKGKSRQYSFSSANHGVLRIHFDSRAKTLTSSWKNNSRWEYFDPMPVGQWDIGRSGAFSAILMGAGSVSDDIRINPVRLDSGDAYFRNFKCGAAVANITVEQPLASGLTDGASRRSFGTAPVGGKGATRVFTIRNDGTAGLGDLAILKDGANAADFIITGLTKNRLDPGAATTFGVTFRPASAGIRKASIHIRSDDPDGNPFDIDLIGNGAAP